MIGDKGGYGCRGAITVSPFLCAIFALLVTGASAEAAPCKFGDASYVNKQEGPDGKDLVIEPANQANGIFLRSGESRQQYFVDLPNNPSPGYQIGIMDARTWKSYPTFVPGETGNGQVNNWPGADEPAPEWILITGLGRFQRVCAQ